MPNAEQFATLLTAMDDAMYVLLLCSWVLSFFPFNFHSECVHDRPDFDVLKSILIAATFYNFLISVAFAKESAFYQLARTKLSVGSDQLEKLTSNNFVMFQTSKNRSCWDEIADIVAQFLDVSLFRCDA